MNEALCGFGWPCGLVLVLGLGSLFVLLSLSYDPETAADTIGYNILMPFVVLACAVFLCVVLYLVASGQADKLVR